MNKINTLPLRERPRERLIEYGPESLSDSELLAILLRTGTKDNNVLDLSKQLIQTFGDLSNLNEVTITELVNLKGIGKTKAIELIACIELGKRMNRTHIKKFTLNNSLTTYHYIKSDLENLSQEKLIVLYLNTKGEMIEKKTVSIGGLYSTYFNPRDVLKWAVKSSAYAMCLCHNHPSGDPTPSKMDVKMTIDLIKAAKLMDMIVCDHIIIGNNQFFSFAENNMLKIE